MKKTLKSKLIALFAGLSSLLLLGGCAIGESLEEIRENRDLTVQVTYFSNGGKFDGDPDVKEMYYRTGTQILNVGVVRPMNGSATIERSQHDFDGWYYVVLDDNGNPVMENEEQGTYLLGDKVNFPVVADEENPRLYLAAKWLARAKVHVELVYEGTEGETIPAVGADGKDTAYASGETVHDFPFELSGQDGIVKKPGGTNVENYAPFKMRTDESRPNDTYTFIQYYTDKECTNLVEWPMKQTPADGNGLQDQTIYAKYVKGDWKVVETATNVADMFKEFGGQNRYWLVKDIDATGIKLAANTHATTFNSEIQGNGFTISNLSIEKTLSGIDKPSLFGNIQAEAIIENLKMENVVFDYTVPMGSPTIYFAFTSIHSNATVNGVELQGVIQTKGMGSPDIRFYGAPYESDEEYVQANGETHFKVTATV